MQHRAALPAAAPPSRYFPSAPTFVQPRPAKRNQRTYRGAPGRLSPAGGLFASVRRRVPTAIGAPLFDNAPLLGAPRRYSPCAQLFSFLPEPPPTPAKCCILDCKRMKTKHPACNMARLLRPAVDQWSGAGFQSCSPRMGGPTAAGHDPPIRPRSTVQVVASSSRAARSPLASAPCTVAWWPCPSVASPAKNSVDANGLARSAKAPAPPAKA